MLQYTMPAEITCEDKPMSGMPLIEGTLLKGLVVIVQMVSNWTRSTQASTCPCSLYMPCVMRPISPGLPS